MRLFCFGLSLLLYANGVAAQGTNSHVVIITEKAAAAKLADTPTNQPIIVSGTSYFCKDVDTKYLDVSETLRRSDLCNKANFNQSFIQFAVENKGSGPDDQEPYLCCIDTSYGICPGSNEIEVFAGVPPKNMPCDLNGQKCSDANFCLSKAFGNANDAEYAAHKEKAKHWKDADICCPSTVSDETCESGGNYLSDVVTVDTCTDNNGRCDGGSGVCSLKTKKTTKQGCCALESVDKCPGGFLPYSFQATTENVWHWDHKKVQDANLKTQWTKACRDLGKTYIHNAGGKDRCCAKAKLTKSKFIEAQYLTEKATLSIKSCTQDSDCPQTPEVQFCNDAVNAVDTGNPVILGKACFPKFRCPHHRDPKKGPFPTDGNAFCDLSKKCTNPNAICLYVPKGDPRGFVGVPAIGMCCDKKPYEDLCTVQLAASSTVTKAGTINAAYNFANCKDGGGKIRKLAMFSTASQNNTVCCEYDTPDGSNRCPIDGKPYNVRKDFNGVPISCQLPDPTVRQQCSGGGWCFETGVCCDVELCADGRTLLNKIKQSCTDPKCPWAKANQQTQTKYCPKYSVDGQQKCCPPVMKRIGNEYNYDPNELPSGQQGALLHPERRCTNSKQCGGYGTYCKEAEGKCWRLGTGTFYLAEQNLRNCNNGKESECHNQAMEDRKFYCVYRGPTTGQGECITETAVVAAPPYVINKTLLWSCIACGLISLISGIFAIIFFLMYRSRNFCDKRKKDWNKNKRSKKAVTTTSTGGATSTFG